MPPPHKIWHQNQFQVVGYDIVDTFPKFDATLICRLKVVTRPALSLAPALIDTIMLP